MTLNGAASRLVTAVAAPLAVAAILGLLALWSGHAVLAQEVEHHEAKEMHEGVRGLVSEQIAGVETKIDKLDTRMRGVEMSQAVQEVILRSIANKLKAPVPAPAPSQ